MSFFSSLGRLAPRLWRAGLRAAPLRMWVLFGAGPVFCIYAAILVGIVVNGGWLPEHQSQQLSIVGWTLAGVGALVAIVIVTIAKVKVGAKGPGGTGLDIDGRDNVELVKADTSNVRDPGYAMGPYSGGGYGSPITSGGYDPATPHLPGAAQ